MEWNALEQLVLMEKENENPIALLISKLDLEQDTVVLTLPDIDDWDEDLNAPKLHHVSLSIKESAHGNAREMFARYRASKDKEAKTAGWFACCRSFCMPLPTLIPYINVVPLQT